MKFGFSQRTSARTIRGRGDSVLSVLLVEMQSPGTAADLDNVVSCVLTELYSVHTKESVSRVLVVTGRERRNGGVLFRSMDGYGVQRDYYCPLLLA